MIYTCTSAPTPYECLVTIQDSVVDPWEALQLLPPFEGGSAVLIDLGVYGFKPSVLEFKLNSKGSVVVSSGFPVEVTHD